MSRDFDDIYKKIDQSHKDLYKQDDNILKNIDKSQEKITKELSDIKKQVKDISQKVDIMLEILNSFTIMLAEDDEDLEDNYVDNYDDEDDDNGSWVPEQDEDWHDYEDDE